MRSPLLPLALTSLVLLAGCSSEEDDVNVAFQIKNTSHGVAVTTPLLISGNTLIYLASEASSGNTDLNGDGDTIDPVAIRVNTLTNKRTNLGVRAEAAAFLNATLFLVVDEALDGTNWNGDGDTTDTVLLYVRPSETAPTFFAELDPSAATPMAVVGGRLLFAGPTAPAAEFDTNLLWTDVASSGAAPSAATPVTTTFSNVNADGISFSIWKVLDGLALLTADEAVDGPINGDIDSTDAAVLAVLDGDVAAEVTVVGVAVDPAGPADVRKIQNDWTVAFLASEAGEGVNLNDPALFDPSWQPANCAALNDTDTLDDVLHWFQVADFIANGNVINTGLVGTVAASEYVYLLRSGGKVYAGVVSLESDEGIGGGCDLNGDLDSVDRIFRWIDASDPTGAVLPVVDDNKLHAVADNVPGDGGDSTGGVIALDPLWVLLVDEAADGRNHDGNGAVDNLLIAAHDPTKVGQSYNFSHGESSPGPVAVSWMAANPRTRTQFLAAITEAVLGQDRNGDGDTLDSIPSFPRRFSGSTLSFPGLAVAVDSDDAGCMIGDGVGFFRLSEAEQGEDLNNDGDQTDFVLERVGVTTNDLPTLMGSLNSLSRLAVEVAEIGSPVRFGAYLYDESQFGAGGNDINGDGDALDHVVRYFRFPE